jgi:uncharacterized protein YbjT (DUF2867 family)
MKLLDAAKSDGVHHFILLSSVMAQTGLGAYLHWKKKTEEAVKASGVPYTILRPSYLAGDDGMPERKKLTSLSAFLAGLSSSPAGDLFAALRPMPGRVLARLILHLVGMGPQNAALSGPDLFPLARRLGLLGDVSRTADEDGRIV